MLFAKITEISSEIWTAKISTLFRPRKFWRIFRNRLIGIWVLDIGINFNLKFNLNITWNFQLEIFKFEGQNFFQERLNRLSKKEIRNFLSPFAITFSHTKTTMASSSSAPISSSIIPSGFGWRQFWQTSLHHLRRSFVTFITPMFSFRCWDSTFVTTIHSTSPSRMSNSHIY